MPTQRSEVRGAKRTANNMRALARSIQRPVSEASREALKPIQRQAKKNIVANGSKKRGVLYRGIVIRQKKRSRGSVETVVSAAGKARYIAHLVEFGTEPHFQPKRGVMHPGAEPKEFLTPAYLDHEDRAIEIFGRVLGPAIERQAERVRRR